VFNETNTSSISIQSQNTNGVNASTLNITTATGAEFSSNSSLSTRLTQLQTALTSLRSQSSAFGSNLSIVQNRTDFTKSMINTLQTGSDNLVLADTNEEGANMLALQTRQQLSITALGLSAQADPGILKIRYSGGARTRRRRGFGPAVFFWSGGRRREGRPSRQSPLSMVLLIRCPTAGAGAERPLKPRRTRTPRPAGCHAGRHR
jgi:hypothetical protein